jgi:hypothetical protein
MLFDITFPERRNEAQKKLVLETIIQQSIICLFDAANSPLYSYEDLIGHDEAVMKDTRALDTSAKYQRACDEYEKLLKRRHAKIPTTATAMRILLLGDLREQYPNIIQNGFDFGMIVAPSTESGLLLDGATAIYAIFPREQVGQRNTESAWPVGFDAPPCLISIPLDQESSCFWGIIGSGVADLLAQQGVKILMDPSDKTAAGRRREALTEVLKQYPMMPLFIYDRSKHFFLCHMLNALGEWAETKLGGRAKSTVALSAETTIRHGKGEVVTIRPSPFLQCS